MLDALILFFYPKIKELDLITIQSSQLQFQFNIKI